MTEASGSTAIRRPRRVAAFVALTCAAAGAVTVAVAPLPAPAPPNWAALPLLAVLLVAATWLVVPFRYGGSVDAINLVEAALAPLLIAFPPLAVVGVVAASQIANGLMRRLSFVKTAFNTGMWSLAAGLGAAVVATVGQGPIWPQRLTGLLLALAVVAGVNSLAVAAVLALAEGREGRFSGVPVVHLRSIGEWGVNVALGVLLALASVTFPVAAALFIVPLLMLHVAYRSYSQARTEQTLLAAAHRAAGRLTEPLQPLAAIPDFLREIAECFEAATVELVLRTGSSREIHRFDRPAGRYSVRSEHEEVASLEGALASLPSCVRVSARGDDSVARTLATKGWNDCLAAPLRDGDRLVGAVLILDRGGFSGSQDSEFAILDTLARETSSALSKGRLMAHILDEQRKSSEIVSRTSDGIWTLADDGTVLTWNPALEAITGLTAQEATRHDDVIDRLDMRTVGDQPIQLLGRPLASLPEAVRLTATDGTTRHLTCSYSAGRTDSDGAALIVVARDVTPIQEHEALLREFSQMVEADAARRVVVDRLQEAVVPAPLPITGADVAAAYQPSDPSEPTGGDLYDWLELPWGEVHVAVVDVLGHGVSATKDALAVVHTLRAVTAAGTDLERVVERADELMRSQHPDLVATVLLARYQPDTGRLRLASGGHPPALLVRTDGHVEELHASGGVIGWPNAGSDRVAETVLSPGDALLLYTDGLVEARKDIVQGMDTLMQHAAELVAATGLSADQFAHEILTRALDGADRRDDALALVLRRHLAPAVLEFVSWECPPTPSEASAIRRDLCAWLGERGLDAGDCAVVAGELLANAVRSARTRVTVRVERTEAGVAIDVADDGEAPADIDEWGYTLPDGDAEGQRGLYLVRRLSERVDVLHTDDGTTIRALLAHPAPDGGGRPPGAVVRDAPGSGPIRSPSGAEPAAVRPDG